jgi:hypothetical protein
MIESNSDKIVYWKKKKEIVQQEINVIQDFLFSGTDALLKAD